MQQILPEDYQFLKDALDHGTVTFIRREHQYRFNRYLAIVGNHSLPLNISDDLWAELGADAVMLPLAR